MSNKTDPEKQTGEGNIVENKTTKKKTPNKKTPTKKPASTRNAYKTTNQKCTAAEEKYINYLLRGETQRSAFKKAFPHYINWKENSIDSHASQLLRKPRVWERYGELQEQHRLKEQETTTWTRDEAMKTLRYVIDKNKDDLDRIHKASEDELQMYMDMLEADPENALQITAAILKKRKTRRMSAIHNQGIINAASELNKMQGFNEENINLNNVVSFSGDDELED